MFGYFYNSSLRRYILLMGDLFSKIMVQRIRDEEKNYIKVPITYASKEHFMLKMNKWTSINSEQDVAKIETVLPRMNLHLVDMMYNPQYKTGVLNRTAMNNPGSLGTISQYNPTAIKMTFELGIFTRYEDDMYQIIEQIMPYFQPHFNTTITELFGNEITFERDIRIVLQSLSIDEQLDGEKNSRRRLEWAIVFEVNGWLYPPVTDLKGEIRTIYLDFNANSRELANEGIFESVDSQVDPEDVKIEDWDGKYTQTYDSSGTPIPVDPEPPKPRGE